MLKRYIFFFFFSKKKKMYKVWLSLICCLAHCTIGDVYFAKQIKNEQGKEQMHKRFMHKTETNTLGGLLL